MNNNPFVVQGRLDEGSLDKFVFECEVLPLLEHKYEDDRRVQIGKEVEELNKKLGAIAQEIEQFDVQIDRLTNHADGLDYAVAVGSGVLAGVLDIFLVGEFSFERGKAWSNETTNRFVIDVAKKFGYKGDRLEGAIACLEEKFKIPSDSVWKGANKGVSAKSHHLDDFAHHPSLVGLICSIAAQFTGDAFFQNADGVGFRIAVAPDTGPLIGNKIPEKLFAGVVNWVFHLISDGAGSSGHPGGGMGLPGPIVNAIKELSAIPGLNKTQLPKIAKVLFVDNKFDLRKEMALGHELGRQALPVILNEVVVRGFYFGRQIVKEYKEKKSFEAIEWKKTLPFNNRTIARMLTIATGTFTAIDLADAGIRAAFSSGGNPAMFLSKFVVRINFVGVGRFVIAVGVDLRMGYQLNEKRWERIQVRNQQLHLLNATLFYKQADMWITLADTEESIRDAFVVAQESMRYFVVTLEELNSRFKSIGEMRDDIEVQNPDVLHDILKELRNPQ